MPISMRTFRWDFLQCASESVVQLFNSYLPTEIVKRRKVQMETFKTAKRRGIPAAFSQAQPDKLYIRGRLWPVGKELPP